MQPESAHTRTRLRSVCRIGSVAVVAGCLLSSLTGCGNVLYTVSANGAASKLEAARQAGAEKTALYEYTLAQEHLTKAMSEASEADYGDAYELARLADGYAEQAVEKARRRMHRASPQPDAQRDVGGNTKLPAPNVGSPESRKPEAGEPK